jgi:tRNA(Ile)-lysidine synthase
MGSCKSQAQFLERTDLTLNLHPTEKKVLFAILDHKMVQDGDVVVVAVSGGADSVCLLRILYELRDTLDMSLIVAHLNHGLRPLEDEKETEFVSDLAGEFNLPLAQEKAHNLRRIPGTSLEEEARIIRYNFFEKVLSEHDAQKVALGHNMNDQAETVLMNLLRGSGLRGLSGIPPIRENRYIRPLIQVTRDEIHAYLREKNMSFIVDSSNLEKKYLRNKIRLDLIPLLLSYQPRFIEHLGELASLCREKNQLIEQEARKCLKKATLHVSQGVMDLSIGVIRDLPMSTRFDVIREAIKQIRGTLRRINGEHVKAVSDLINNPKPQVRASLPEKLVVTKTYERLRFATDAEAEIEDFSYRIEHMGSIHIPETNQVLFLEEVTKRDFSESSPSPHVAFVDLDRIAWPLWVRNFRIGDKFMPLGMKGSKKVKDVFIDKKISREERKRMLILADGNNIIWVCGIRIDERYRVRGSTRRILRCEVAESVL